MDLSVIVPVRNNAQGLRECLVALRGSDLPPGSFEIIVVDDASEDGEVRKVALEAGDFLIEIPDGPRGPAHARNRGVECAQGEIVGFVDADVRVHSKTLSGFVSVLRSDSRIGAVFGAYDTTPEAPGLVSQYRNLQHHFVHTLHPGVAETFWAGCGAVKKRVFVQVGGFNDCRYQRPQVEDIELGHRIRDAGWLILLQPELMATHLKRWTLFGGVVADVRDRGAPWAELMIRDWGKGRKPRAALNLVGRERLATVLALVGWAAATATLLSSDWRWLFVMLVAFTAVLRLNWTMIRWFANLRGWSFALAVIPLRFLYYTLHPISVGCGFWLAFGDLLSGNQRVRNGQG